MFTKLVFIKFEFYQYDIYKYVVFMLPMSTSYFVIIILSAHELINNTLMFIYIFLSLFGLTNVILSEEIARMILGNISYAEVPSVIVKFAYLLLMENAAIVCLVMSKAKFSQVAYTCTSFSKFIFKHPLLLFAVFLNINPWSANCLLLSLN